MTLTLWTDAPSSSSMHVRLGSDSELNPLLSAEHYLGPLNSARIVLVGELGGEVVAGQVWKWPTARNLPSDGTWLELSRWVLTPRAGRDAGSRFHGAAVRILRAHAREVTTLVSYSDPSAGHTGALYRACNWQWSPTWHRLRPPPTGGGAWVDGEQQAVKDRWVFPLRRDPHRHEVLAVGDLSAIRSWSRSAPDREREWARRSPALDLRAAVAS